MTWIDCRPAEPDQPTWMIAETVGDRGIWLLVAVLASVALIVAVVLEVLRVLP